MRLFVTRKIENFRKILSKFVELIESQALTMDNPQAKMIPSMLDMVELERDRMVLERLKIDGISIQELSRESGLSESAIKKIEKRVMKRLEEKAAAALSGFDIKSVLLCKQYVLDHFEIHRTLRELKENPEITSYGLCSEKAQSTLEEIKDAMDSGKMIIAVVDGGELIGNPFEEKMEDLLIGKIADHCVVVIDLDTESQEAMLYDPAFGDIPLTVAIDVFKDAWDDSSNTCYIIGKES